MGLPAYANVLGKTHPNNMAQHRNMEGDLVALAPTLIADERLAELAELRERVERLERWLVDRARPLVSDPSRSLTAREREVAELVANGKSNHQVAQTLSMSTKTVEWNLSKIYRKVHVSSRTELSAKLTRALQN